MAVSADTKRRPVIEPIQTGLTASRPQRRNAISVDTPTWSASPLSALPPPEPMLPDIAEERMAFFDDHILETLRLFDHRALSGATSSDETFSRRGSDAWRVSEATRRVPSPLAPSPRHSPGFGGYDGESLPSAKSTTNSTYSDTDNAYAWNPQFTGRRQSAPSISDSLQVPKSRRGSRDEATARWYHGTNIASQADCWIIPVHFSLPANTPHPTAGSELSWPVQPDGTVKVRVLVTPAVGQAETIAKCFNMDQMRSLATNRTIADSLRPDRASTIPCPAPGTVLPVPGGTTASNATSPHARRFSTAMSLSPASTHSSFSSRRSYRNELPAEPMDKATARAYLPILGAIMDQNKRPIGQDDIVTLPLPYAKAWTETVQYVYEGRSELLSESVKRNILHLGGRA